MRQRERKNRLGKARSGVAEWVAVAVLLLGMLIGGVGAWWLFSDRSTAGPLVSTEDSTEDKPVTYTCSMHPQIKQPKPGKCPMCFMDLIPLMTGDASESGTGILTLGAVAQKLAEVRVQEIHRGPASRAIRLVGTLGYDETALKHVTAWVAGRIDRLFVNYTGISVKQGDHMAEIYSPSLIAAQEELQQARGNSGLFASARERLLRWGIAPDQLRDLELASTPVKLLTLTAPTGGIVIDKAVTEGMYVNQGTLLFSIARLDRLWLNLAAYEADVALIQYGQQVSFSVDAFPGEAFAGFVAFIDPIIDPKNRTIRVRVNVANPDGRLKPGLFARAVVLVNVDTEGKPQSPGLAGKWISPMHPEVVKDGPGTCDVCGMALVPAESLGLVHSGQGEPLVVPDSAVLWTGRRSVVYREFAGKQGTYQGVDVILGPWVEGGVIIREGLKEGDRVVVNGAFKIDSELQIRAQPSMMEGREPEMKDMPGMTPVTGMTPVSGMSSSGSTELGKIPLTAAGRQLRKSLSAPMLSALDVARALSEDSLESAHRSAQNGLAELGRVSLPEGLSDPERKTWSELSPVITGGFQHIGGAKDLSGAREGLRHLTGGLDRLWSAFGQETGEPVVKMFCPMAFDNQGAVWFQRAGELANPYFGAAMLRCGEPRETLPSGKD
jgi:Cu(I)/Ag(I) efflux system membrane fusion protein